MTIIMGAGWDELGAVFGELIEAGTGDSAYEIMLAGCEAGAEVARELVPVDTGELKSTIHVEHFSDAPGFVAETDHAEPVEFGTSRMAAQPYMRPAGQDSRVKDAISRAAYDRQSKVCRGR